MRILATHRERHPCTARSARDVVNTAETVLTTSEWKSPLVTPRPWGSKHGPRREARMTRAFSSTMTLGVKRHTLVLSGIAQAAELYFVTLSHEK